MRLPKPPADLPDAKSPEDWEAVLAGLRRDAAAGQAELAEIEAERRGLALASVSGDRDAMERIAGLNQRQDATARRVDVLGAAQDAANAGLAAALARREQAVAGTRRAEACTTARALLAQSARVDAALAELTAALASRAALARRLAGTGGPSVNHLMNRTRLLSAATHAGLDGQLEIGRAPRHLSAPLRQIDRTLLRDLLPPGEAEDGEAESAPPPPGVAQLGPISPPPPVPPPAPRDPAVRW